MSSRHPRDPWIDYTGGVAQRTPVSARSERRAEASNQLGGWRRPESQTPQLELGGGGLAQPNAESTRWPTDPSSWGCGLGKRAKRYAQADCNCALVIGRCVRIGIQHGGADVPSLAVSSGRHIEAVTL